MASHSPSAFAGTSRVTVWSHVFSGESDLPIEFIQLLDDGEIEKCRRYRLPEERRRFVAGRALLRKGLSAYTGQDPKFWHFELGDACKTKISATSETFPLDFSVAHSGKVVLVAVSDVGPCGIDVEKVNPSALSHPMEGIFTQSESTEMDRLPKALRDVQLIRYWTAKEAYAKYRGLGFHLDFLSFEASFDPPKIHHLRGLNEQAVELQTEELKIGRDTYFWSLVTKSEPE